MADIWLLRLAPFVQDPDAPGWFVYAASADASPVSRGGVIRHPSTIAEVEVVESIDVADDGATGEHSARVSLYLSPTVATLAERGWRISGWWGELAIWRSGTSYESREIVFRGTVDSTQVAGTGQSVELTLLPPELDTGAVFPPSTAVVSTLDTWTTPQNDGNTYPFVFGSPGAYRGTSGSATVTSASRAYVVDTTAAAQVALIAGHRVAASTVRIYSAPEEAYDDFAVTHQEDLRGRMCAVVDVSGKDGVWTLDENAELYVTDWGTGGMWSPLRARSVLAQAGDVLLYLLLQQRPGMLDVGAWMSALPKLNRVRLDGVWSESAVPWEWAQEQILPALPWLWVLGGPFGARPVLLDETDPSMVPEVTIGRDLYRGDGDAPQDQGTGGMISRSTVSYAIRVRYDRMRGQVSMSSSRRLAEIGGAGETATAKGAAALVGDVEDARDLTPIYSRSEAYAAAVDVLGRWGRLATVNAAWGPLERRGRYALGRCVRLNDADFGYRAVPAWVTGRRLTLTRVEVTFTDLR